MATAPSPMSRVRRVSRFRCSGWALPWATTTTTGLTISSSQRWARVICFTTMAMARLPMSRRPPGCGDRANSRPAPPGWITTATGNSTSWLPTMCSGPSKPISTARSTARTSLTARRSHTKARRCACGTTWAAASLKTQRNKLYANKKNGTFEERGVAAGIGFSEDGIARAGMGTDAADYDRSGHASVMISNFANQMVSVYHNKGNGLFVDEAPQSEVGRATLVTLGFGCFFFDYDNDG